MQKHHGAREVFLTQQSDANCAVSLLRKCRVCSADDYDDCSQGAEGVDANNVYLCEYDYDTVWQVRLLHIVYRIAYYTVSVPSESDHERANHPSMSFGRGMCQISIVDVVGWQ